MHENYSYIKRISLCNRFIILFFSPSGRSTAASVILRYNTKYGRIKLKKKN